METTDDNEEQGLLRCTFFVERKKRTCRYIIKAGKQLCPEHELASNINTTTDDLRIPCPLDPKHTCYKSKLKKHMKVCNARAKTQPDYIEKGCNAGCIISDHETRTPLKDIPLEVVSSVIKKIEDFYDAHIKDKIENNIMSAIHEAVSETYYEADRGEGGRRHLNQCSSLIQILEKYNLLKEETCVVEMGAGKGGLAYYISRAINSTPSTSVLLVERGAHRHKKDNKLDNTDTHQVQRIRGSGGRSDTGHHRVQRGQISLQKPGVKKFLSLADINDLLLNEVDVVKRSCHVVGVSKHLCGVATDFALRCLTNPNVLAKTNGVLMATCCHHQCVYGSYVARQYLEENNISKENFNIICGLVSWATCGDGFSRVKRKNLSVTECENKRSRGDDQESDNLKLENVDSSKKNINSNDENLYISGKNIGNTSDGKTTGNIDDGKNNDNISDGNIIDNNSDGNKLDCQKGHNLNKDRFKSLNLSYEDRVEIGRKAKAVLDYGRCMFLNANGFKTKLCYYVTTNTSPENVCILAFR